MILLYVTNIKMPKKNIDFKKLYESQKKISAELKQRLQAALTPMEEQRLAEITTRQILKRRAEKARARRRAAAILGREKRKFNYIHIKMHYHVDMYYAGRKENEYDAVADDYSQIEALAKKDNKIGALTHMNVFNRAFRHLFTSARLIVTIKVNEDIANQLRGQFEVKQDAILERIRVLALYVTELNYYHAVTVK